jgi:hypothetical protein
VGEFEGSRVGFWIVPGRNFPGPERKVSDVQLVHLEELTLEGKANTSRVSKILNNVKPKKLTMDIQENWSRFDKHFWTWFYKQNFMEELHLKNRALKIFTRQFPASKNKIKLKTLTLEVTSVSELRSMDSIMANFQVSIVNFCQDQQNLHEVNFLI